MSTSTAQWLRKCTLLVFISTLAFGLADLARVAQAQGLTGPAQTAIAENAAPPSVPPSSNAPAPAANLPDAPLPANESTPSLQPESSSIAGNPESMDLAADPLSISKYRGGNQAGRVPLDQCPYDKTHAKECRPHWHQLIISSSVFNLFQNTGNLYTSYYYRLYTSEGNWFEDWANSDLGWRWGQWHDGNPFLDDWVGHPIMGGITNTLWIQNDPRAMTVEFGNNRQYWHSRLCAMLYSTAYSFEWKFGPFGEAGIGHNGDHNTDLVNGVRQNDTGDVELVSTPVGGLGWTIAEDFLDQHVVRKIEEKPRGTPTLLLISLLTPSRATANILRWRTPWYRDSRQVRSTSFFSDPPGPEDASSFQPASSTISPPPATAGESSPGEAAVVRATAKAPVLPLWPHYGGVHEVGAWWGVSWMSGPLWGTAQDTKYMPIDMTYSHLLNPGGKVSLRYAPEMNVLAMLDEPVSGQKSPILKRRRTYGSGFSPLGLRASFWPESRVQPFLSTNEGAIYFVDSVLAARGSHYMATVDFGGGLTIFRKQRQSVSIGYRYQHLFNANIGSNAPTTDANTFYVAVSRFRTRGYR